MLDLSLKFEGPFHLAGGAENNVFISEAVKCSGIYLFAIDTANEGTVVRYVGETGVSFEKRLKETYYSDFRSNYRIAETESLRQMSEEVLWDGLWRRGRMGMIQSFIDQYVELAPFVKDYLDAYRIFLAPIPPSEIDQRKRRLTEGALARHFQDHQNLMAPDIRYCFRKKDEESFKVSITAAAPIVGLPCLLTV